MKVKFLLNVSVFILISLLLISPSLLKKKKKAKEPVENLDIRADKDTKPINIEDELKNAVNCNPDLPNLSVGDYNLTTSNFYKYKEKHQLFILGISDKECL